jgi:hypothetical protein
LACGCWYDPARPHVCGGDDTRRLEERIDALEQRLIALEAKRPQPETRKANHRTYMVLWRARQKELKLPTARP